jgi:hypothetical protein
MAQKMTKTRLNNIFCLFENNHVYRIGRVDNGLTIHVMKLLCFRIL